MFTSLLVGLDGSVHAHVALAQAIEIGQRFRARIVLAHVIRPQTLAGKVLGASWMEWSAGSVPPADVELQRAVEEMLNDAAGAVRRAGLEVETVTRAGEVADVLRELAEQVGVVIVGRIGIRGRQESESADPLGPDTRELIRRCPRPVLVCGSQPTPMDRVLVAYAGGPASEGALAFAARFAGITGAHLDVLHVSPDPVQGRQALARASGALSMAPLDFDMHLLEGELETVIPETVARLGINALFAGAHREETGWSLPSHTETILRATDVPVLVHMHTATSSDRVSASYRRPPS